MLKVNYDELEYDAYQALYYYEDQPFIGAAYEYHIMIASALKHTL
jgi:hypothetical protein